MRNRHDTMLSSYANYREDRIYKGYTCSTEGRLDGLPVFFEGVRR
jgi:hypothetical protein